MEKRGPYSTRSVGCEYILVDISNENAMNFYRRNGYHSRMITSIKKITED